MELSSGSTSPSIYIVASDGTRFAIPEEAAAFSSLLKGALDKWNREHAPPPPEDDDTDNSSDHTADDSDATAEMYGGETTPDRLDDDAATYTSSHTAAHNDGPEDRGLLPGSGSRGAAGLGAGASSNARSASTGNPVAPAFAQVRRMVSVDADADDDATPSDEEAALEPGEVTEAGARNDASSDRTASVLDGDSRGPSNGSSLGTPSPQKGGAPARAETSPPRSGALFTAAAVSASSASGAATGPSVEVDHLTNELQHPSPSGRTSQHGSPSNGSQPRTPQVIDRDTATPSTLDEEDDERGVEDMDDAKPPSSSGSPSNRGSLNHGDTATVGAAGNGSRSGGAGSPSPSLDRATESGGSGSTSNSSNSRSNSNVNLQGFQNDDDDDDATPEELPLEPVEADDSLGDLQGPKGSSAAAGGKKAKAATAAAKAQGAEGKKVKKLKKEKDKDGDKDSPTNGTAKVTKKVKKVTTSRKSSLKGAEADSSEPSSSEPSPTNHVDPVPATTNRPAPTTAAAAESSSTTKKVSQPGSPTRKAAGATTVVVAADSAGNVDDDSLLEAAMAAAHGEAESNSSSNSPGTNGGGALPIPVSAGENSAEWISPTSVHQRTPVMLGDDDEVFIVRGDGQEEALEGFGRQNSPSPSAPLQPTPSPSSAARAERSVASNSNNTNSNSKGTPRADADAGDGLVGSSELRGARITATEILIDLRASSHDSNPAASPKSPATTASDTTLPPSSSTSQTPASGGAGSAARGGSNSSTLKATAATTHICVNYLLHFARANMDLDSTISESCNNTINTLAGSELGGTSANAANSASDTMTGRTGSLAFHGNAGVSGPSDDDGRPAVLQNPLPAPLIAQLSPWEQHFLYVTVLGYDDSILESLAKILRQCPHMDYQNPGSCLKDDDKTRKLLLVPPPPPAGMQTLRLVMAAAKELRVDSLYSLCCAWMADHMLRICYGSSDNFEAAHLIRQSFHMQSDWSRKETDCLKVENEWPANEEEC